MAKFQVADAVTHRVYGGLGAVTVVFAALGEEHVQVRWADGSWTAGPSAVFELVGEGV